MSHIIDTDKLLEFVEAGSCGLKDALIFFGAVLFIIASVLGVIKWMEFVDEHIED